VPDVGIDSSGFSPLMFGPGGRSSAWAAPTPKSYPVPTGWSGFPVVGDTDAVDSNNPGVSQPYQRGSFSAVGLDWAFWYTNSGSLYSTSSDFGANWSTPADPGIPIGGRGSDIHFDGEFVHVAISGGGFPLTYYRGTPDPGGFITWGPAQNASLPSPYNDHCWEVSINTDSAGFPWIAVEAWSASVTAAPVVTGSATKDGTWTTRSGHPFILSTTATAPNVDLCWVYVGRLNAAGDMIVFFWYESEIYSRVFDRTTQTWQAYQGPIDVGHLHDLQQYDVAFATDSVRGTACAIWCDGSSIWAAFRSAAGGWTQESVEADNTHSIALSVDGNGMYHAFFVPSGGLYSIVWTQRSGPGSWANQGVVIDIAGSSEEIFQGGLQISEMSRLGRLILLFQSYQPFNTLAPSNIYTLLMTAQAATGGAGSAYPSIPVGSSPQSVNINRVIETDNSRTIIIPKNIAVTRVTETDTARSLAAQKAKAVARVTETDVARTFTWAKSKAVNRITETDTARALSRLKTAAINRVTETDAARAFTRLKSSALGRATETDAARFIQAHKGYASKILQTANLALYYRLGESSGTVANEARAGLNGTYNNSPTLGQAGAIAGDADTAVLFQSANNYVSIPSTFNHPTGGVTVEFWNYWPSSLIFVHQGAAFNISSDDVNDRNSAHVPWWDGILYWDFGGTGSPAGRITADYTPYLDKWTYVALRYDAATDRHSIVLDGVEVAFTIDATRMETASTGGYIGSFGPGSGLEHFGSIDEFAVYDRYLSLGELQGHYVAGGGSLATAAINQVIETDVARALVASKSKAVARVTETDVARTIIWTKSKAVARVTETDVARALGRSKNAAVQRVTETDLARALSRLKSALIGRTNETDIAQSFSTGIRSINRVIETDTARALTSSKVSALNRVSETDLARSLTALKSRALSRVSETDLSRSLALNKLRALGRAVEGDVARVLNVSKVRALGRAIETDFANTITSPGKVNRVTETDTAQPLVRLKTKALGRATETDLARTIIWSKAFSLARVTETDTARPLTPLKVKVILRVTETDTARALTHPKSRGIVRAVETDLARQLPTLRPILRVLETDYANALTVARGTRYMGKPSTGWAAGARRGHALAGDTGRPSTPPTKGRPAQS
jgi:hypothetical protein